MHGIHSVYDSMEDGLQRLFKVSDPVFHIVLCTGDYTADHLKLCPRQGLSSQIITAPPTSMAERPPDELEQTNSYLPTWAQLYPMVFLFCFVF